MSSHNTTVDADGWEYATADDVLAGDDELPSWASTSLGEGSTIISDSALWLNRATALFPGVWLAAATATGQGVSPAGQGVSPGTSTSSIDDDLENQNALVNAELHSRIWLDSDRGLQRYSAFRFNSAYPAGYINPADPPLARFWQKKAWFWKIWGWQCQNRCDSHYRYAEREKDFRRRETERYEEQVHKLEEEKWLLRLQMLDLDEENTRLTTCAWNAAAEVARLEAEKAERLRCELDLGELLNSIQRRVTRQLRQFRKQVRALIGEMYMHMRATMDDDDPADDPDDMDEDSEEGRNLLSWATQRERSHEPPNLLAWCRHAAFLESIRQHAMIGLRRPPIVEVD